MVGEEKANLLRYMGCCWGRFLLCSARDAGHLYEEPCKECEGETDNLLDMTFTSFILALLLKERDKDVAFGFQGTRGHLAPLSLVPLLFAAICGLLRGRQDIEGKTGGCS